MSGIENKSIGTVKVGEKGQVVIPKDMRDMFGIKSGDILIVLADTERGIAILPPKESEKIRNGIFGGDGNK